MRGQRGSPVAGRDGAEDLWVFGYGSLMWRPGFEYLEVHAARLYGFHRSFCVYSWHHRGTREKPGLVLGLDAGGSCLGRVFRVAAGLRAEVEAYLDDREMVTAVYRPVVRPVDLLRGDLLWGDVPARVAARCYIVDRSHHQYAGRLPIGDQAQIIRHARGQSGINTHYLESTVQHLNEMGITGTELHAVQDLLEAEKA